MRVIIVLLSLLLLLIGTSLWSNQAMLSATEQMSNDIKIIRQDIHAEAWDEAYNKMISLEETLSKQAKWWSLLIDHQEMESINISLVKAKEYVLTRNKNLSLGQISELAYLIMHLPEKDSITIKNIF